MKLWRVVCAETRADEPKPPSYGYGSAWHSATSLRCARVSFNDDQV